jgi:hypothetical protein
MARKLKTFETSLGFFEQAIAAPSMKAALEVWGADSNLFHQGAAKESTDPDVIAPTMKKPGVVLKRPVGSDGPFGEHAELPKNLGQGDRTKSAPKSSVRKMKKSSAHPDEAADRKAAQAYERERQRREREETREEATKQKKRERIQQAIDKVQAALDKAEQEHAKRATALRTELDAIELKIRSEDDDWEEEKKRLKAALRRARD